MTAPIRIAVICRVCGAERLQEPWAKWDGYMCDNCGATNWPPLMPAERIEPRGDVL